MYVNAESDNFQSLQLTLVVYHMMTAIPAVRLAMTTKTIKYTKYTKTDLFPLTFLNSPFKKSNLLRAQSLKKLYTGVNYAKIA